MALTVMHTETSKGYTLVRSDGERFLLHWSDGGNAVLYQVQHGDDTPSQGLVDFDVSVTDKLQASQRYVLSFPNNPDT